MMVELDDVIKYLEVNHPDKMLIDDIVCFERGRLAGHIEIILELIEINEEGIDDGRRTNESKDVL